MLERQLKRHSYADRLKYMRLLAGGRTFDSIHLEYGINYSQLKVLWEKYQLYGAPGLKKRSRIKADFALKREIVLDIADNHLTLHAASLKYGVSPSRISSWLKLYREYGWSALEPVKKRSRPTDMGRPRKGSKPLTELEQLRKENQELRTEIALLKKVRALVEERQSRLRAIGRGPSKD